jgi:hypothetical protein
MEPIDIRRADDGKGTLITLEVKATDAQKLLKLFREGQFAELGITDMRICDNDIQGQHKWKQTVTSQRSDSKTDSKQRD